jgi:hypothetical protein
MTRRRTALLALAALTGATLLAGCGPNLSQANDDLRAENLRLQQAWQRERDDLRDREATIRRLEEQLDERVPRIATLPKDRLDQMFTVGRIQLRAWTDAWDFNGDDVQDGFRVYYRTMTENGDVLPATGTLTVEAFDLADAADPLVARKTFTPDELRNKWYGGLGLDQFAVNVPWQRVPAHTEVTFRISFVDALTGRVFQDQKLIRVHLTPQARVPEATRPATVPATSTQPAAGRGEPPATQHQ